MHVSFEFWYISSPYSAKQQRAITTENQGFAENVSAQR